MSDLSENLPETSKDNSKINGKVSLNSVSVIFHFALFWIFCESVIFQNAHKILENDTLMGDLW